MTDISISPVAYVRGGRVAAEDDNWGAEQARIVLVDALPAEALMGLETFSHAEIIFQFHLVPDDKIERGARHPRGNTDWPKIGIFAQRGKNRPNRLGVTVCRIRSVSGRELHVEGLDAIDGTPVLDIKPVLREFLPRGDVLQPDWASALMAQYW